MTREEFKPMAKKMKIAYQKDGFLGSKESTDLWYDMLKDLDAKLVLGAVEKYIKSNTFQPTIADIRKLCEEEQEKISKLKAEMREIFEQTMCGYPGINKLNSATVAFWNQLTAADTWEKRVDKARYLSSEISAYVRCKENEGAINRIPTFTEYLEKKVNELHR